MSCHTKQVSGDVLLEGYRSLSPSPLRPASKRARSIATEAAHQQREHENRRKSHVSARGALPPKNRSCSRRQWAPTLTRTGELDRFLPPLPQTAAIKPSRSPLSGDCSTTSQHGRAPSPSPSISSSFSGVTTSAALSSRASLSSCRSSFQGSSSGGASGVPGSSAGRGYYSTGGGGSTPPRSCRSSLSSRSSFYSSFPSTKSSSNDGRWRRGGMGGTSTIGSASEVDYSRLASSVRDRGSARWESNRERRSRRRGSACGGGGGRQDERPRSRGYKRSRSCSREQAASAKDFAGGVECSRCLKWCRASRERRPITRTLPMEYWVRTPECKAAKSNHIEYIDNVAYSREQFIEETVFTCPFTGVQRDTLIERNMFPYDVPTDVEHWTLWSRQDLTDSEMEAFVTKWVAENHPHVVEWECDNNEGDRSIDWYHVHVFFRLGCEDNSGAKRDPASVYKGPCHEVLNVAPASAGKERSDGEARTAEKEMDTPVADERTA